MLEDGGHMQKTVLGLLIVLVSGAASAASVSFYFFEDHGTSSSGHVTLKGTEPTEIPVSVPWFDYKCTGESQIDGVLISCAKGGDVFETKAFCAHPKFSTKVNQVRNLRVGKGKNFVSFEISCR